MIRHFKTTLFSTSYKHYLRVYIERLYTVYVNNIGYYIIDVVLTCLVPCQNVPSSRKVYHCE